MTLVALVTIWMVGLALVPFLTRGWTQAEQRVARWSLAAHIASAPAQELIYRNVYGGGDMFHYLAYGEILTHLLWQDPARFLPEVIRLLLHADHDLPLYVLGQGSSTGSMSAASALLGMVVGPSLTTQGAIIACASYTGKCASHSVFRAGLSSEAQRSVAMVQFLLPTTVFWSAALLKESAVFGAVGWLIFSMNRLVDKPRWGAVVAAATCAWWIGLFKAYILVGFAAGFGAWIYVSRVGSSSRFLRVRPVWLVVGFSLSVLMVGAVGEIFPQYDVQEVGERIAFLQEYGESGGSSYDIGDSSQRSLIGQMSYAPLALLGTFFRPLPIEISSTTAAINSVESFGVLVLYWFAWRRSGFRGLLTRAFENPRLAFAIVYVVVLAVGIGLATSNLGTLSRYRAPFYAVIATVGLYWYQPSLMALAIKDTRQQRRYAQIKEPAS